MGDSERVRSSCLDSLQAAWQTNPVTIRLSVGAIVFAAVVFQGAACAREEPIDLLTAKAPDGLSEVRPVTMGSTFACWERVQKDGAIGVWFAVVIDTEGTVKDVESLGPSDEYRGRKYACEREAAEYIRQWRFAPVTLNGKPVSVRARVGHTVAAVH